MQLRTSTKSGVVTRQQICDGLQAVGLKRGDAVLVHAAMRTLGRVEGGADTVVDALLETVGPAGTVVVPTFTFAHETEADPIIDPANDPSEMGAISEATRRRPAALRSTAFRHSFAAIGRRARVITEVDPALSPFDLRSSFGVMLALGTQVLMLGLTYSSSTSHHFAEWVCDVPYRQTQVRKVKLRRPDGSLLEQTMIDYQPKPSTDGSYYGTRKTDFNRLGRMLEEQGKCSVGAIGNAVVRRFNMRDLIDLSLVEAEKDYNVFRTEEGKTAAVDFTPLADGRVVLSPEVADGAHRLVRYQWAVLDEKRLQAPA